MILSHRATRVCTLVDVSKHMNLTTRIAGEVVPFIRALPNTWEESGGRIAGVFYPDVCSLDAWMTEKVRAHQVPIRPRCWRRLPAAIATAWLFSSRLALGFGKMRISPSVFAGDVSLTRVIGCVQAAASEIIHRQNSGPTIYRVLTCCGKLIALSIVVVSERAVTSSDSSPT